jgi:hypothetical protein
MRKLKIYNLALGMLVCAVLTGLPLRAQSKKNQAQKLVDKTILTHPEVTGLELSAAPRRAEELPHNRRDGSG